MKEKELRQLSTCSFCNEKLFANNVVPMFWTMKVSQYILDTAALQRQTGLEMMMGGAAGLAQVMSPNEDLAKEIGEEKTLSVCMECMTNKFGEIYEALEKKEGS